MKSLNDPVEEESTEQSFCETAARKSTFSRCIRHSLKSKFSRVETHSSRSKRYFQIFFQRQSSSRHTVSHLVVKLGRAGAGCTAHARNKKFLSNSIPFVHFGTCLRIRIEWIYVHQRTFIKYPFVPRVTYFIYLI